jgi:hypothetical protein
MKMQKKCLMVTPHPSHFIIHYFIDLYACDASLIYSTRPSLAFTPLKKPMSKIEILQQ